MVAEAPQIAVSPNRPLAGNRYRSNASLLFVVLQSGWIWQQKTVEIFVRPRSLTPAFVIGNRVANFHVAESFRIPLNYMRPALSHNQ